MLKGGEAIPGDIKSISLHDLDTGVYRVKVAARNKHGWGLYSEPVVCDMLAVPSPPVDVEAVDCTATSFKLRWKLRNSGPPAMHVAIFVREMEVEASRSMMSIIYEKKKEGARKEVDDNDTNMTSPSETLSPSTTITSSSSSSSSSPTPAAQMADYLISHNHDERRQGGQIRSSTSQAAPTAVEVEREFQLNRSLFTEYDEIEEGSSDQPSSSTIMDTSPAPGCLSSLSDELSTALTAHSSSASSSSSAAASLSLSSSSSSSSTSSSGTLNGDEPQQNLLIHQINHAVGAVASLTNHQQTGESHFFPW